MGWPRPLRSNDTKNDARREEKKDTVKIRSDYISLKFIKVHEIPPDKL